MYIAQHQRRVRVLACVGATALIVMEVTMRFTKRSFVSMFMMALMFCVAGFASSKTAAADPSWPSGWDWSDSESVQAPVGALECSVFDLNGAPLGEVTFTSPMSQAYVSFAFDFGFGGAAPWVGANKQYQTNGSWFQFKKVGDEWYWRGYIASRGHYTVGKEIIDL